MMRERHDDWKRSGTCVTRPDVELMWPPSFSQLSSSDRFVAASSAADRNRVNDCPLGADPTSSARCPF
jgi:hypothetical protein